MDVERRPRRCRSRATELPPDLRERLDEMLLDDAHYYTYQEIADEIARMGGVISTSAIGRYALRMNAAQREAALALKRQEAILQFARDNPNFDAAKAMLALTLNRLTERLVNAPDDFADISADKALGHIIRAARTAAQLERVGQSAEADREQARQLMLEDMRAELSQRPELLDQIERLLIDEGEAGT